MKSRADLFGIPNNEQLNSECTKPDLATNDAIDGITIFNCGFNFKMPHMWTLSSIMRYG